ncbi:uncharacterized protein LOC135841572 [Planococcus citri]|uniref:uncharacterized protein LOC135841572 n=1 Tax=Planococcus citri TaxID=170843 RepID=UPI0031F929D6
MTNPEDIQPPPAPTPQVEVVEMVKLPPLPKKNIRLWFAQVEAQFTNRKITAESTKFSHIVGSLDHDIAERVLDIIFIPPANPYTALKDRLIKELEESAQQKLRRFLQEDLTLDDQKPTILLRKMRSLAEGKVNDTFLKDLFTQRMPAHVRAILATLDTSDLDKIAQTADKIVESVQIPGMSNFTPTVAAVSVPTPSPSDALLTALTKQVADLTLTVQNLMGKINYTQQRRSRSRSPSYNSRSRSRNSSATREGVCWYHRKFKDNATRCTTPCTYDKQTENSESHR